MTQQEYNGWTNYDTWFAFTFITSYEHTYNHALEVCKTLKDSKTLRNAELKDLLPPYKINKQKVNYNELVEGLTE